MRHAPTRSVQKLSADGQRLIIYAQAVMQAASRLEERGWERNLDALLLKLLKNNQQSVIDTALEHTYKLRSDAYDALMDSVESISECCSIEHNSIRYDALLIAAPILAWTRFSIASGPIPSDILSTLSVHLYAHVLAQNTRMTMVPALFAIDQLPRTHAETLALTTSLAQTALKGASGRAPTSSPETVPFLADTRYLLAVAVVPEGQPIFRWQESLNPGDRQAISLQWETQALPSIKRLLPGCGVELLLPNAYHAACREADRQIRPASIRAAVHYITHALNIAANSLQVTIGGFGEQSSDNRIDEYRVGFCLHQSLEVVYGLVWPLYGQEAEDQPLELLIEEQGNTDIMTEQKSRTTLEEIMTLLQDCGVTHIKYHEGFFPMESCEDCGAPLFLDMEAEPVHAQMPEDVLPSSGHFH
ncbi:MAG TPA: DUF2863 family protein [Burkholderiaceae bacterium]|nr:DUF2863 family protein [Burkholderiaceae bacterium]